jgi:hypothetical protein
MRTVLKIVLYLAIILVLTGMLIVATQNARHRGKLTQCKMNLSYLGRMAWQFYHSGNNVEGTGRTFWHNLREVYEMGKVRHPDPYVCPVLGLTPTDYKNPKCIDYRGPSKALERNEKSEWSYKRRDPIGCDRKGNHGENSYGFVLFLDLGVEETTVDIIPAGNDLQSKIELFTSE